MVLGGNLSRVSWQEGFPPDNPNMGAFAEGIHARFINGANMHKALRLKVRKAKAMELKIQELAFNGKSEARRERAKMIENRHWYDRKHKGELRTGNDREHGRVTILD